MNLENFLNKRVAVRLDDGDLECSLVSIEEKGIVVESEHVVLFLPFNQFKLIALNKKEEPFERVEERPRKLGATSFNRNPRNPRV